jgi:hypothetical protein
LKRALALEKHDADYFFPLAGREEDFDFELVAKSQKPAARS